MSLKESAPPELLKSLENLDLSLDTTFSNPVRTAMDYMKLNYQKIDTLPSMSQELDINYNSLRERFRRETRLTMLQYLSAIRLKQAYQLLTESDMQIKEIAWQVGYKQESQLTKTFQKHFKILPHLFRTQHRHNDTTKD